MNNIDKNRIELDVLRSGGKYIGPGKSIKDEIIKYAQKKLTILYFCQSNTPDEFTTWEQNWDIFFQLLRTKEKGTRFYAVDCDVNPNDKPNLHSSCIQVLDSGRVIIENLRHPNENVSSATTQPSSTSTIDNLNQTVTQKNYPDNKLQISAPSVFPTSSHQNLSSPAHTYYQQPMTNPSQQFQPTNPHISHQKQNVLGQNANSFAQIPVNQLPNYSGLQPNASNYQHYQQQFYAQQPNQTQYVPPISQPNYQQQMFPQNIPVGSTQNNYQPGLGQTPRFQQQFQQPQNFASQPFPPNISQFPNHFQKSQPQNMDYQYEAAMQNPPPAPVFNQSNIPQINEVEEPHDPDESVASLISQMAEDWPRSEMNILILGETGVGKSTWINGFKNFITYNTLDDAERGELCTLIPAKFTVCDENFDEITVVTGEDINESGKVGQSATQDARIYRFTLGNTTIQLIDTPGVGDTRGIDQDKVNFQNILSTLENVEEIHGICILLKPNNARLTVMFRFCIKELLTYLHRDAAKNILFCFTNSRGTFYRPGDTMPALKKLLAENKEVKIQVNPNNVYCFDSEAYRFLAAIKNKNPVKFHQKEKENFSNSWEKSIMETLRMLNYISALEPHPIKNTLNLNHARELVLKLTRPLAEISRNIQTNMAILDDERNEIQNTDATLEDLRKKRFTKRAQLEIKELDYPKTVCGNSGCVKVWNMGHASRTEYINICHERCYLSGVQRDSIADPGLMQCWAFHASGPDNCRQCGHSYREHLHVYYDSFQVEVDVNDQTVEAMLSNKISEKEAKQRMIEDRNRDISKYNNELDQIQKASVKFACFLKSNAITPYNDEMEKYLNHLIKQEEEKAAVSKNTKVLDGLKVSLAAYQQEKRVIEEAMIHRGQTQEIGAHEISKLVNDLKALKISGTSLQDALNTMDKTNKHATTQSIVTVTPVPTQYRGSSKPRKGNKLTNFLSKIF